MHDLISPGPRYVVRHGVRFQGVLVDGRRGPGHAHFFSAEPNVCIAALFRGHSGDWPTEAANVCRWAMATLFGEPSYEGTHVFEHASVIALPVLRAFEEETRASKPALDAARDPSRVLTEIARRIDSLVERLQSPDLGGASGVLVALTPGRAHVLRRGAARAVRLAAGGADILIELDQPRSRETFLRRCSACSARASDPRRRRRPSKHSTSLARTRSS